jgi:PAS domain S-box-containing protein
MTGSGRAPVNRGSGHPEASAHRRGNERLREGEPRWVAALNSLDDLMMIINVDYTVEGINDYGVQLLGKTRDDVVGAKCYQVVHSLDAPCAVCPVKRMLVTGRVEAVDRYEKAIDRYFSIKSSPIFDEDGELVRFVDLMRDITAQKRVEAALRASEETWRSLLENIPDFIITVDRRHRIVMINRGVPGVTVAQAVGTSVYTYVEPAHHDVMRRALDTVFHTGRPQRYEVRGTGSKGPSTAWYETRVFPNHRSDHVASVTLISTDITERKQAEAELVRLSTAVKMSRDSIVISALDGTIVEVNDATVQLYGIDDKAALLGTSSFNLIAPEDRDKALAQMRETRDKGYLEGIEYNVVTKKGVTLPVEVSVALMKDGEDKPTGFVVISRDITERKRREEEMKRRLMRFHLDDGTLYLVKERVPTLSIEAFNDLLTAGYRGYVVTRTPEAEFRQGVMGPFTYRWLAARDSETAIPPTVEALTRLAESLPRKAVLLVERLDYVFSKNGVQDTVSFVQYLRETALLRGTIVILSLDPATISPRAVRLVEKEAREVDPRVVVRLSEDLLELVRLVYEQNVVGVKPNHAAIGRALGISKPTVRKRIHRLITTEYVTESVKGSSKVVELTEKGMRLFVT